MKCKRYSKLQKLLRVTALVKKFAAQFKVFVNRDTISVDFTMTAADVDNMEMEWIGLGIARISWLLSQSLNHGRINWVCSLIRMRYGDTVW